MPGMRIANVQTYVERARVAAERAWGVGGAIPDGKEIRSVFSTVVGSNPDNMAN